MKKKNIYIMLAAFFMLAIMSSMLIVFLVKSHENFPKNIKVREDGVTEDIFTVRDLRLCPDQSKEYEVDLVCDASGAYNITLTYEELQPGTMKHYVDVVVKANGETLYTGKLSQLLDGEAISFNGVLYADKPLVITILYTMPYEIGNEAQGTSADFDVYFKIQKI